MIGPTASRSRRLVSLALVARRAPSIAGDDHAVVRVRISNA
jgi:hypothetical protein